MKQDIENIIRTNLPEEKIISNEEFNSIQEDYSGGLLEGEILGHNQCLSQIPVSLIADEVLKIVVEKIETLRERGFMNTSTSNPASVYRQALDDIINLLKR